MELIFATVIALLFSAFFSGVEIAFFSANKLVLELQKKEGDRSGRILSFFNRNTPNFIGTTLVGNNIALVLFGMFISLQFDPILAKITSNNLVILLIQTIIATIIVLFFGEFIPKSLFRINPVGTLRFLAVPLRIIYFLLYPIVIFTTWLAKLILKTVARTEFTESSPVFSKLDLHLFVKESSPDLEEDNDIDTELFENALYLTKVKVRECMVPRREIKAVEINSSIEELKETFIETGLSRVIIFYENLDNIIGYAHHFDLLNNPTSIGAVMHKIGVVPETMTAWDLLNLFKKEQKSIAYVVDEFGGTAGIVTMEDLLEELFGEIHDEYDEKEFVEQQLADGEFIFSGRLEIDYINEKYNLNIPEGEYETLAGYILAHYHSIPKMSEKIEIDNFEISFLFVSKTRVETVKLKVLPPPL